MNNGPWFLTKRFVFEASHRLPKHDGKCARLHGHSWVLWVRVGGAELRETGAKQGMVIDYSDLKAAVQPLVDDFLDHWHLNDSLKMESPTSERVAHWVFHQLQPKLPGLVSVGIEETCTAHCEYWP